MDDDLGITLGLSRPTARLRVTAEDLDRADDNRLVVRPEDLEFDGPPPVWVTVDLRLVGWVPARVTPVGTLTVGAMELQPVLPAQAHLGRPAYS